MMRVFAGLLSVAVGALMATFVLAATGELQTSSYILGVVCLGLGFAGLGITRTTSAPLRAMRVSIALGLLLASAMIAFLPWPPSARELSAFLVLALGIVASVVALVLLPRSPRFAVALLVLPCLLGALSVIRTTWALGFSGPVFPLSRAVTLSYVVAAALASAWVGALWHARSLWQSFASAAVAQPNEEL